jgi:hypothetical protein
MNDQNKLTMPRRITGFIMRAICMPFFVPLVLIGMLYHWLRVCINYLLYGGEIVAYTKLNSHKMMNDVYVYAKQKLDEKQYIDSIPEDINQPLFNYFSRVHNITLLESEMQDLITHAKSL